MISLKKRMFCALGLGVLGSASAAEPLNYGSLLGGRAASPPRFQLIPRKAPAAPCIPCPPSAMPSPLPSTPTNPSPMPMPPSTDPINPLPPVPNPEAPSANRPGLDAGSNLLAEAPARGTGSGGSLLPTVAGDLLGGGGVAGPLPAFLTPDGRFAGIPPVLVLPSGQTVRNIAPVQPPVDELIRARVNQTNLVPLVANPVAGPIPAGSVPTSITPPPGFSFDPSLSSLVSRIPQVARGPFKVTENDTPRPTTRVYASYYFYDEVFKDLSGPNTPRVRLSQELLGYEQAFWDRRASVGIRLPFNQLTSPGGINENGIGDLTLVSKFALYDNRDTGSLISAGLLVTVPTADRDTPDTLTGRTYGGTLLQPFVGYILRRESCYLQGFSSIVVPTNDNDVTFLANDLQLGFDLYRAPGQTLSAIIPTFEVHVNTPVNHRDNEFGSIAFPNTVTLLGGTQFLFFDTAGAGISAGAPITGPRPFSLQVTVQLNLWF